MYYLGFLKSNTRDVVVFKSTVKPKPGDFKYFTGVMGPYRTEKETRKSLQAMRGEGYRENPSQETRKVTKDNIKRMIALSKKVMKLYGQIRKQNPGKSYHDQKFLMYMRDLEKYVIGSAPYIATLAKAYEHLQSAKDSIEEYVRK